MTEEEWFAWDDPRLFLQSLRYRSRSTLANACTARRLRLFAVACCRRVRAYWSDERIAAAVDAAEAFVDARTNAEKRQLKTARRAVNADESWLRTTEGILARGVIGKSELTAAIVASLYPSYLMGGASERIEQDRLAQGPFLRDIVGNPFRPVAFDAAWRTSTAVALAKGMYESRDFSAMPILADALQDAGCDSDDVLNHCRGPGPHVRGCWVIDLVLDKN
jgi:hypothetical protein